MRLGVPVFGEALGKTTEEIFSEVFVGVFPASEFEAEENSTASLQKLLSLAEFDLKIIFSNVSVEADFLFLRGFYLGFRFLHFVEEFPVVFQFADWWVCVWGDLDEINSVEVCEFQSVSEGHDLVFGFSDDPNLGAADIVVDAMFVGFQLVGLFFGIP